MTSIGIFTYSTKPRGSVVHATCLAEALAARGHDVTLYALSKSGDRLYRELDCPVVYLPAEAAAADPDALIAQRVAEIAGAVGEIRPRHDVYHAEDCLVASGLLARKRELGLSPLVRTLHHLEHFESRYLQECQRRSILEADAVACVSRVSRRDVWRALGRACPIIGNGVDVQRFAPNAELMRWTRDHFDLSARDKVVLSVGGVEPRKNSLQALDAMIPLLTTRPTLRWLIAGGASIWEHEHYRGEFRARVAALHPGLRSRITELGQVSERELTGLYQISQILLCPSVQEGFGLCVLEALSARAAVVVSNREPFTEYLSPDSVCFVEPGSAVSIRAAVERLVDDPQLRARLTTAGAVRARAFSWDRVAVEHERLYAGLLGQPFGSLANVYEESAYA